MRCFISLFAAAMLGIWVGYGLVGCVDGGWRWLPDILGLQDEIVPNIPPPSDDTLRDKPDLELEDTPGLPEISKKRPNFAGEGLAIGKPKLGLGLGDDQTDELFCVIEEGMKVCALQESTRKVLKRWCEQKKIILIYQ